MEMEWILLAALLRERERELSKGQTETATVLSLS